MFGIRTYPKTSIYCDRLQRSRPALSSKNVLNVQQARLRAFFTCRLGLDLFAQSRDETGFGIGSSVNGKLQIMLSGKSQYA